MRVALDTNGLYTTRAGVARYLRGVERGLAALAAPDVQWEPFAWPVENLDYRQPQRAWRTFRREILWAGWSAPRRLTSGRFDVYHATASMYVPPPRGVRYVVTLHDLGMLRHPERFRRWQRWAGLRQVRRIYQADRIVCISRFTADEAMKLLALPAGKIDVVYNGCDFHAGENTVAPELPDFFVPPEFFLFVGSLEPGKNLVLLRETYLLAAARGQPLPPLLIVGARWPGTGTEGPPPPDWHYLGHQPDAVLLHLYQHALALVFPSKYEGFGLPVAEAMAAGCPVLCSPVASLPEVGGDAVCYAPMTAAGYLDAMLRLSRETGWRKAFAAQGRAQAARFTWKNCAEGLCAVYRAALAAP